jgi:hypothetical protein
MMVQTEPSSRLSSHQRLDQASIRDTDRLEGIGTCSSGLLGTDQRAVYTGPHQTKSGLRGRVQSADVPAILRGARARSGHRSGTRGKLSLRRMLLEFPCLSVKQEDSQKWWRTA